MKKRIVSLILVMLMCFTFFYGCGKKPAELGGELPDIGAGDSGDLEDDGDIVPKPEAQEVAIKLKNKSVVYSGQAYTPQLKFFDSKTDTPVENVAQYNIKYYMGVEALSVAPVDSGNYSIEVLVDSEEYVGEAKAGFEILRKQLSITMEDQSFGYGEFTAPLYNIADINNVIGDLDITYTYDGIAEAPEYGTFLAEVVAQNDNYYGKVSATMTIGVPNGKFAFNESGTHSYDGNPKIYTVSGNVEDVSAISYTVNYYDINGSEPVLMNTAPVDSGRYKAEAVINYQEEYIETIERLFVINKQNVLIDFAAQDVYYGDGITFTSNLESLINVSDIETVFTYDGEATLNGYGTKKVVLTISNANCYGTAIADVTYLTQEESFLFNEPVQYTYDGTAKEFTVRGRVSGQFTSEIKYYRASELLTSAPVNAGSYSVLAEISYNNKSAQISTSYVIGKKNLANEFTVTDANFVYGDPTTSTNAPVITAPDGVNAGDYTVTYALQANNTVEQFRAGVPYSPGTYKAVIKASETYSSDNYIIDGDKKFDIKINNAMDGYKFAQYYHENVATKYNRASVANTVTGGIGSGTVRVNTDIVKNNNEFLYTTQSQGNKIVGQSVTFAIQTYQKTGESLFSRRIADSTTNVEGKLTTDFKSTAYSEFSDSNADGGYAKKYGANPQGFSIYIINETTVNNPDVSVAVAKDSEGNDRAGYVSFTFELNGDSYANYKVQLIAYANKGKFKSFEFCKTSITLDKWGRCEQFNVDEYYKLNAFIDIPTNLDSWETFDYSFNDTVTKPL